MKVSMAHNSSQHSISTIENGVPNFPKVQCAFHPHEVITNFCTCECCLLPLCPSCIKIHTNEHINLKGINPQYQPINELLQQIYEQVQEQIEGSSSSYRKITQIDAKIGTFRTAIQQKIQNLKNSIISETETYFTKLEEQLSEKIDNISYIKQLTQFKDQTKKSIIGLKNVEKSFNLENVKLMRLIIKYKGCNIKEELEDFQNKIQEFISEINHNFITFSIREDYKDSLCTYLDSIHKVEISDINPNKAVPQIFNRIKEVYQKQSDSSSKKQIMKSLGTLLQNNSNYNSLKNSQLKDTQPYKHHSNSQIISPNCQFFSQNFRSGATEQLKTESYNSVSNEIRNMQYLTQPSKQEKHETQICEEKENQPAERRRRSLSKGKGLSLMQMNSAIAGNNNYPGMMLKHNNGRRVGMYRAVDITQPVQLSREFNRTAIIRKSQLQFH